MNEFGETAEIQPASDEIRIVVVGTRNDIPLFGRLRRLKDLAAELNKARTMVKDATNAVAEVRPFRR